MKFLTAVCVVVALSFASVSEAHCGSHRGTRCHRRAVRGHHCARGCANAAAPACNGTTCNSQSK